MAMLGDVLLHTVYEEKPDRNVDITDHPIEDGANVSDHVQREPLILNISGVVNGSGALKKLTAYQDKGARLKYSYRNIFEDMVIQNFSTGHGKEVKGGFSYSLTLKQILVAKKAVAVPLAKPVTNGGTKQPVTKQPATKAAATPAKKVVVVAKGDTLGKIAAKNGTTAQALYEKNKGIIGKNKDLIYPGQKLVI